MTTILLTGMPGCGKEEFLNVAVDMNFKILRMGDVVRQHAEETGLSMEDRSIGSFANGEREKNHPAIWAQRTMLLMKSGDTVIDGVRSLEEVDFFKQQLGSELRIVAVHASPETRYKRLVVRGRGDAPATKEDFDKRDERELNWGIGNVIAKADVMLVNEGSLEKFYEAVKEFFDN